MSDSKSTEELRDKIRFIADSYGKGKASIDDFCGLFDQELKKEVSEAQQLLEKGYQTSLDAMKSYYEGKAAKRVEEDSHGEK